MSSGFFSKTLVDSNPMLKMYGVVTQFQLPGVKDGAAPTICNHGSISSTPPPGLGSAQKLRSGHHYPFPLRPGKTMSQPRNPKIKLRHLPRGQTTFTKPIGQTVDFPFVNARHGDMPPLGYPGMNFRTYAPLPGFS